MDKGTNEANGTNGIIREIWDSWDKRDNWNKSAIWNKWGKGNKWDKWDKWDMWTNGKHGTN